LVVCGVFYCDGYCGGYVVVGVVLGWCGDVCGFGW